LGQWATAAGDTAIWLYYALIVGVIGFIGYLLLNIFTYDRKMIRKERVGQEFTFDTAIRVETDEEEDNKPLDSLKMTLDIPKVVKEEKKAEKLVAIPTITKSMRGKLVKRDGKFVILVYRFMKKALKMKVIGPAFWNFTGNSKKRIELLKLSNHIYAPIVTIMDKQAYQKAVYDETYINWVVNDIEEDTKKFQKITFWERYGSFIITASTFLLCLIFVVVVFKNMQEFADAGTRGAEVLANACVEIQQQTLA
jgi:hypothetical protein